MASPILTCFPQALTAGDTARVQLSFGKYPPVSWTSELFLNKAGVPSVRITGSSYNGGHLFIVLDSQTANCSAGDYTWGVRVSEASSGDSRTAGGGTFTMLPNYAGVITPSPAALQLAAANEAFAIVVANPESSVSFNGQSFTQSSSSGLLDIISRLEAKVKQENDKRAGLSGEFVSRAIRPYFT